MYQQNDDHYDHDDAGSSSGSSSSSSSGSSSGGSSSGNGSGVRVVDLPASTSSALTYQNQHQPQHNPKPSTLHADSSSRSVTLLQIASSSGFDPLEMLILSGLSGFQVKKFRV